MGNKFGPVGDGMMAMKRVTLGVHGIQSPLALLHRAEVVILGTDAGGRFVDGGRVVEATAVVFKGQFAMNAGFLQSLAHLFDRRTSVRIQRLGFKGVHFGTQPDEMGDGVSGLTLIFKHE